MADAVPYGSLAPQDPNPVLAGAQPGATYNTQLDPGSEQFFRQWLQQNKVPFDPDATAPQDYDMRGFYQGLQQGNPKAAAAVDPNDSQLHYPDYWKTPLHQTFSNESQWAPANAPAWNAQDQLVSKGVARFCSMTRSRRSALWHYRRSKMVPHYE